MRALCSVVFNFMLKLWISIISIWSVNIKVAQHMVTARVDRRTVPRKFAIPKWERQLIRARSIVGSSGESLGKDLGHTYGIMDEMT